MLFFASGAGLVTQARPVTESTRSTFSRDAVRVALGKPPARDKLPTIKMPEEKIILDIFTKAMDDFKNEYPQFAKWGWGPSVKAETWNGRHAMFGFLFIWISAFCQGHGLIPPTSELLDIKQWGTLADLGGGKPISAQRAVILIAHVHVLIVSIAATIAPFSFQDKLFLEEGELDDEPMGLIPLWKRGLTKEAETWNGRLAMLGILVLVGGSFGTNTPFLELTNKLFGNVLF
ncbi:hypothetical protein NDN08_004462 [Rhodosorus marinus]|uniref:Uncharacterized protein n=1 Tax=Rhodosorus marinus TaxID=101924 RepID=A0AAV8UMU4_9RHOD|nr:hypothetical protein NDN08_004462 [Rhodosorus marinus]